MKLKGKKVVVTGAASGIGLATARAFAEVEAQVILTDVNVPAGEDAARELSRIGDVRFMHLDVTDPESAERLAKRIETEIGGLDVLRHRPGSQRERQAHNGRLGDRS